MVRSSSIAISAQLASLAHDEHRRVRRRIVNFAALLEEHGTETHAVSILDLSERGCRVRSETKLKKGAALFIKLPHTEALRASVVWSSETEAGCAFDEEMHPAAVEQVIASATPKRRIVQPGQQVFGLQAL
jgi:hypothetical protein